MDFFFLLRYLSGVGRTGQEVAGLVGHCWVDAHGEELPTLGQDCGEVDVY